MQQCNLLEYCELSTPVVKTWANMHGILLHDCNNSIQNIYYKQVNKLSFYYLFIEFISKFVGTIEFRFIFVWPSQYWCVKERVYDKMKVSLIVFHSY